MKKVFRLAVVSATALLMVFAPLATIAKPHAAKAANITSMCGNSGTPTAIHHVVWIWMENEGYDSVVNNANAPYQNNTIASQCGTATNFHNESHGSLDNYIAATGGQNILNTDFTKDCLPNTTNGYCMSTGDSIYAQTEAAGKTWRGYDEDMPSNCNRTNVGNYAARHNPAVYYSNLTNCATYDLPMGDVTTKTGTFYDDVANGNLPSFSFVTPNQINNAHDGTVTDGDTWLSKVVPQIVNGANYQSGDTAIFITNDEGCAGTCGPDYALNEDCTDPNQGTTKPSCHVPTFVVAPYVAAGTKDPTFYTHYSMLRTAEELLGLPLLGLASSATSMASGFNLIPGSSPTPPPANTLSNPGFETWTSGLPDNWALWGPSTQVTQSSDMHSGSSAAQIATTSSSYTTAGVYPWPAPQTMAGMTYTASCWVKSSSAITLNLQIHEETSGWASVAPAVVTSLGVTDANWHQLQVSYTATTTGNMLVMPVYSTNMVSGGATFSVDDCALTTGAIPTPPADTTPPSAPTNLAASAPSPTQVNLSWTAATDDTGVTGYEIQRNGTAITTVTGTSYSDTSVAASTNYTYAVVAIDAAGNRSAPSTSVSVTTPSAPTTQQFVLNPSFETNLNGWTTLWNPTNTSQGRVNTAAHAGSYSMKIASNSSSTTSGGFSDYANRSVTSTVAGKVYTASAWVKPSAANMNFCIRQDEYSGSTKVGSTQTCPTFSDTNWHQIKNTITAAGSGHSLIFYIYSTSLNSSRSFLADDLSLTT